MQSRARTIAKEASLTFAAMLILVALVAAGCAAAGNLANTITSATTAVPITITDAPSDEVLAASLTLNSIVLTDLANKTASILTSP